MSLFDDELFGVSAPTTKPKRSPSRGLGPDTPPPGGYLTNTRGWTDGFVVRRTGEVVADSPGRTLSDIERKLRTELRDPDLEVESMSSDRREPAVTYRSRGRLVRVMARLDETDISTVVGRHINEHQARRTA